MPITTQTNDRQIRNILDGGNNMCRIATGTYTGNDADSRTITGLGFDPKAVGILYPFAGQYYMTWCTENMAAWTDITPNAGGAGTNNRVNLYTDGFELNNGDANDLYNNLNDVYYYIAWG